MNIWVNSVPGRGNSKCKGPETGISLACLRSNTEASVAAVGRDKVGQGGKGQIMQGLLYHGKKF